MSEPRWTPLNLDELIGRLREAKARLEEAAAVGLAQDLSRLENLASLQQQRAREAEPSGNTRRRQYR